MALPRASDVEYLGSNMSGGMCIGLTSSDLVGFFGTTPTAQLTVTAPSTTATTTTNEVAIKRTNAALVTLGLIVTS